jgi:hypothetical protein
VLNASQLPGVLRGVDLGRLDLLVVHDDRGNIGEDQALAFVDDGDWDGIVFPVLSQLFVRHIADSRTAGFDVALAVSKRTPGGIASLTIQSYGFALRGKEPAGARMFFSATQPGGSLVSDAIVKLNANLRPSEVRCIKSMNGLKTLVCHTLWEDMLHAVERMPRLEEFVVFKIHIAPCTIHRVATRSTNRDFSIKIRGCRMPLGETEHIKSNREWGRRYEFLDCSVYDTGYSRPVIGAPTEPALRPAELYRELMAFSTKIASPPDSKLPVYWIPPLSGSWTRGKDGSLSALAVILGHRARCSVGEMSTVDLDIGDVWGDAESDALARLIRVLHLEGGSGKVRIRQTGGRSKRPVSDIAPGLTARFGWKSAVEIRGGELVVDFAHKSAAEAEIGVGLREALQLRMPVSLSVEETSQLDAIIGKELRLFRVYSNALVRFLTRTHPIGSAEEAAKAELFEKELFARDKSTARPRPYHLVGIYGPDASLAAVRVFPRGQRLFGQMVHRRLNRVATSGIGEYGDDITALSDADKGLVSLFQSNMTWDSGVDTLMSRARVSIEIELFIAGKDHGPATRRILGVIVETAISELKSTDAAISEDDLLAFVHSSGTAPAVKPSVPLAGAPGARFRVDTGSLLGLRRLYASLGLEPIAACSSGLISLDVESDLKDQRTAVYSTRDLLSTIEEKAIRETSPIRLSLMPTLDGAIQIGGAAVLRDSLRLHYSGERAPNVPVHELGEDDVHEWQNKAPETLRRPDADGAGTGSCAPM